MKRRDVSILSWMLVVAACDPNDGRSVSASGDQSTDGEAPKTEAETPASQASAQPPPLAPESRPETEPVGTTSHLDVASDEVDPVVRPPNVECQTTGDGKTSLVFVNRCDDVLTVRGSDVAEGLLAPGASLCRDIGTADEELPAKRYWAFAGTNPGNEHYTLAEFTFNTDFNDFDWYNISHVDAFNLPMQLVPLDKPDCRRLTCAENLLDDCPAVGRETNAAGEVVVCVSPDRDDGQSEVALYFERCEDAYAWSGDDQHGEDESPVAACAGEDWEITFCPE